MGSRFQASGPSTGSRFQASGLSMWPALLPGDELGLGGRQGLSTGDVVAYLGRGQVGIAHRLLGRCAASGSYLIRGDNRREADACVPSRALLGRVVEVWRPLLGRRVRVPAVLWARQWMPTWISLPLARLAMRAWRLLPLDPREGLAGMWRRRKKGGP